MKGKSLLAIHFLVFLLSLVDRVKAADEALADKFLGNPTLILTAIIVIDIIAFVVHKIRK